MMAFLRLNAKLFMKIAVGLIFHKYFILRLKYEIQSLGRRLRSRAEASF